MKAHGGEVPRWWRRLFGLELIVPVAIALPLATLGAHSTGHVFPDLIELPADFGPEGIATGYGHTFYVGSLVAPTLGQILVGDVRTGDYSELVPPTGRMAAGIKFDSRSNFLFVAGGTSGRATVYDAIRGLRSPSISSCRQAFQASTMS